MYTPQQAQNDTTPVNDQPDPDTILFDDVCGLPHEYTGKSLLSSKGAGIERMSCEGIGWRGQADGT